MKYKCEICNYETDDKSHLNRHFKTKKHTSKNLKVPKYIPEYTRNIPRYTRNIPENIPDFEKNKKIQACELESMITASDDILSESETDKKTSVFSNENDGFFCRNCGKNFKHKSGYYRHKNHRCKEKDYRTINNDIVDKLQKKIDSLKREKDFHREKEDIYKTENEFHKNLTTNAGNIIGKSLSTLAYVMNNFKHPPQIKAIDNDEFKRLVFEDSGIKVDRRNKISDFDVSKTLCSYHRHNKLVRLLHLFQ
jgi:hypothetical protein